MTRKATKKATKEMTAQYHEWRRLSKVVSEMETELKAWVTQFGPLPISDSAVWDGIEQVEESVAVDAPGCEAALAELLGELHAVAVKKTVPKNLMTSACMLLAKQTGVPGARQFEMVWDSLRSMGYINETKKKVFRERRVSGA